jgi:AraC family transcriptional regulator, transcriptional activator of pobA
VTLNAGFWKTRLSKPALYFKTPCQVVSWTKPAAWLKEYFIVFTETFLLKHKSIADIVFELPFFQLEKAIPFEIEPDEVELLTGLYKQILKEYKSDNPDKFELIASYTHILLIHVRRLYEKYTETDTTIVEHILQTDRSLIEKFRALIRKKIAEGDMDKQNRTVRYFAEKLFIHPNYLNAVVKRSRHKTAIAFIHEQVLHEAKSLLTQTELSIKEISFRLGFSESSHFNHFFKRGTLTTPALFRKQKHLSFLHNYL